MVMNYLPLNQTDAQKMTFALIFKHKQDLQAKFFIQKGY